MNIQLFFTLYALSIPLFIIGDLLWIGLIAKDFYQTRLGHLLGDVQWEVVIIFYFFFLLGLTFFAIYPAAVAGSLKMALFYGALFGFFTYLTYDLTNLATLKDWPLSVVFVDVIWGAALCGGVAFKVVFLYGLFQ